MTEASASTARGRILARLFAIDLRALAAFRISLATILLVDLALRARELRFHYSDDGVMPREILNPWASETLVPLHLLSGDVHYQAALFVVSGAFALLLALGLWTRIATVGCWALVLSLWVRNPTICGFADTLVRMLLFWSMFLPLGARWSLDARRRAGAPDRRVLSVASAALMLQVVFVYFFTAMQKSGPDWRSDFSAIHYALSIDWVVRPLGAWLSGFPFLLEVLTVLTMLFEIVGPLLLLSPVATPWVRIVTVLAFFAFQTGLGLSLNLGIFPFVNSAMMLVFLPARVWDRLERALGLAPAAPTAAPEDVAPAPRAGAGTRIAQAAAAVGLVYAVAFNVADAYRDLPFPKPLARAGHWLGLNQHWGMYSPNGPRYDGWYVIPGTLRSGEKVNLWHTGPELSWDKPEVLVRHHASARSSVYELNLSRPDFDAPGYRVYRERYAAWLCRRWNREHAGDERLESLEIHFMLEPSAPPGVTPRVQRRLLLRHTCSAEAA